MFLVPKAEFGGQTLKLAVHWRAPLSCFCTLSQDDVTLEDDAVLANPALVHTATSTTPLYVRVYGELTILHGISIYYHFLAL